MQAQQEKTMSDTDSGMEVEEKADRHTNFVMPKVNQNHWKENGDLHCRVSNAKIVTVCTVKVVMCLTWRMTIAMVNARLALRHNA